MIANDLITPVILSGGAGTRLWPSSRDQLPKQFLPLVHGKSTFEGTLERVENRDLFNPAMVLTGTDFRFLVADVFARMKRPGRIVLEPMRRDSGPAIAVAAELIQRLHPNSLVLVLAADHLVTEIDLFVETVLAGVPAARNGAIVTFGIKPDKPATGYGYIEPGAAIDADVRKVAAFKEKPSLEKAATLIAQGCLWNSGNFLFRADVLLQELKHFEPAIAAAARHVADSMTVQTSDDVTFEKIDREAFARSPSKSIDFAVMERTTRAAMIPARFAWSDLGSWESLWEAADKDENGNAIQGSVTLSNVTNSFVLSDDLHTAVVGLDNIAVIATHDAVLVAPRQVSAELKPLVAALSEEDATKRLTNRHRMAIRRWGQEDDVLLSDGLNLRVINIKPGHHADQEPYKNIATHLIVVHGKAELQIGERHTTLEQHGSALVEAGLSVHIKNNQRTNLQIVEVCVGSTGA
jgi:mannose-1-phosphate guanylyltransferase / mannose-6-phosphate isomerase